MGSGGGGGYYEDGYSGGGSLKIICNQLIINKFCGIYCNGDSNSRICYGGGGSGGSIYIISNKLVNYGYIMAKGGMSYHSGGNGRIRIDCKYIISSKGHIKPNIGYNKELPKPSLIKMRSS